MTPITKDQKIGQYRIVDAKFGKGAGGDVYLVVDESENLGVMKFLPFKSKVSLIEQFKSEYQYLKELNDHDNLARALDFGMLEDSFYLITEYIEGENLYETVYSTSSISDIITYILPQILEGLDFIHKNGVVHLDIKPENIIVTRSDDISKRKVKIIDLGVAAVMRNFKNLGQGTLPFVAPEIILGKDSIDGRADLFSFAATVYYCLTRGSLPFLSRIRASSEGRVDYVKLADIIREEKPPDSASKSRPGIPRYIDDILNYLLAKKSHERFYPNARSVLNALTTKLPSRFGLSKATKGSYLVPIRDQHIGRKKEQEKLNDAISVLGSHGDGKDGSAVFAICGEFGMGKSHLLGKVLGRAQRDVEKNHILYLELPVENSVSESWVKKLNEVISKNDKPVLVLIDNLDNSKINSDFFQTIFALLERIIERSNSCGLYDGIQPVILCYTTDGVDAIITDLRQGMNDGVVKRIELKPFTLDEVEDYLKSTPAFSDMQFLEADEIAKNWRKWIGSVHNKTEGIPLDIYDYLHELDSEGVLFDPAGGINLAGVEFPHNRAPEVTKDRLFNLYKTLSPREKNIIDLMAVWSFKGITRPIEFADISNFFYDSALLQILENLCERKIVKFSGAGASERTYEFYNTYFPILVYEQIPLDECEEIHDGVAAYLRSDLDSLCLHSGFGSDKKKALKNLLRFGKKSLKFGNLAVAEEMFQKALGIASGYDSRLQIYVAGLMIETLYNAAKYDEIKNLDLMFPDVKVSLKCKSCLLLVDYLIKLIPVYLEQNEFIKAMESIEKAEMLAAGLSDKLRLVVLDNYRARLSYKKYLAGHTGTKDCLLDAKHLYEDSEKHEKNLKEKYFRKITNNDLGTVLRALGDFSAARSKFEKKLKRIDEAGNVFDKIHTLMALADVCRMQRDYKSAESYIGEVMSLTEEANIGKWMMYSHAVLANIYHDTDRFESALAEDNRCLASSACFRQGPELENFFSIRYAHMGQCYNELKQYDKAIVYFSEVVKKNDDVVGVMTACEGLGEAYFYKEDYDKGLLYFDEAKAKLVDMGDGLASHFRFRINYFRAKIFLKQNRADEAAKLIPELKIFAENDEKLAGELSKLEESVIQE